MRELEVMAAASRCTSEFTMKDLRTVGGDPQRVIDGCQLACRIANQ